MGEEVRWGVKEIMAVGSSSAQLIPAKGAADAKGRVRSSGSYLIQPIDGSIRIAYDGDASDTASALIGQDVRDTDGANNAVSAIRDSAEGSDVSVLVCYEVQ